MSDTNTLQTVIDQVLFEIEGGFIIDESLSNPDFIRDIVLNERAALISELYIYSSIPKIYMQRCCINLSCESVCGSKITEWQSKIPSMFGSLDNAGFHYVGPPDYSQNFEYKRSLGLTGSYSIVKNKKPFYSIVNGNTMVVKNKPDGLKRILIEGVFADPFSCECLDNASTIIVPGDKVAELTKRVMFKLSGFMIQKKLDKRNDTAYNNQNNPTQS